MSHMVTFNPPLRIESLAILQMAYDRVWFAHVGRPRLLWNIHASELARIASRFHAYAEAERRLR